jgi:hypothetical protein
MAKKQKENKVFQGKPIPTVEIIGQRIDNGLKYLNGFTEQHQNDPNYIPEYIQPVVNEFVRNARLEFDMITEQMYGLDKASDEYIAAAKDREGIARRLITAREQIDIHKNGIAEFKGVLGGMSKGTKDVNLYTNMIAFGAQSDSVAFGDDGKMQFASVYGSGQEDVSMFHLDDMRSPSNGDAAIITEPYGSKAYVWKMAEKVKEDSDSGKDFDYEWAYTRIFEELSQKGAQNTIGMAFADLAGDNSSKSFADMYDGGLSDGIYYINPETGRPMPKSSEWMKDSNNAGILQKFLGKYITDVMKDVHGSVDEETGQLEKSKSEIARELIKKYSK